MALHFICQKTSRCNVGEGQLTLPEGFDHWAASCFAEATEKHVIARSIATWQSPGTSWQPPPQFGGR